MKRTLTTAVVAIIALALMGLSTQILHAEDPEHDLQQGAWAPYPEDRKGAAATEFDTWFDLLSTTSGKCIYSSWGDWPHLSRNNKDVSAHGYWEDDSSGQCPQYADVEVWIEAHRCTLPDHGHCWWEIIASNKERVRASDLGGKRVNARRPCATFEETGYRTVVDVDLVGESDPPDKAYSIPRNVGCKPSP